MADPNMLNQVLAAQLIAPQTQAQLMAAQQQQAIANAMLSEGLKPIDTNGRSIGGVGYSISPWEGVSKLAQVLSGKSEQKNANQTYIDALSNAGQGGGLSGLSDGSPIYGTPGHPTSLGQMEILNGNRAVAEMLNAPPDIKNAEYANPQAARQLIGQIVNNQANPGAVEYQKGLGTSAAEQAPAGQLPPGVGGPPPMTPQPPITPVDGPQAIPPVNMNQLQAPQAPMGNPMPPPATAFQGASAMQQPSPAGMTNAGYKAALETAKAGGSALAAKLSDNLADATKTYNVAASSLPRAMQRFDQLRKAASNSSYGGGVSEEDPGSTAGDYARNFARTSGGQLFEPGRALANQTIDQATKQGVLAELGPQLAGLKGNRYLETIASGASGLNPADPPDVKINAVNGLQDQYISNLKTLAQQRRQYGDPNAPTDLDLANLISQHASPDLKISVVDPKGQLGRVDPSHLVDLVKSGGQIR